MAFASSDGNVRVFLAYGNGGFTIATGSPFPAGTSPAAIAARDFNGDGKGDLAVANSGDGTVSIFLGDGKGGFSPMFGSPFQAGGAPVALTVADFNGDGRADVAVVNGTNSVTILQGYPPQAQTISFAALPNIAVSAAPFSISATASSGMPVTFASNTSSVCAVSGNTVTILVSGGCSITATQTGNSAYLSASATQGFTVWFADVDPAGYAYAAINAMALHGITAGCGSNNFCPNDNVTRDEMAIFVVRAIYGSDNFTYSTTPYFTDVTSSTFGFKWIQKLKELGVTAGCTTTTYCPTQVVTRDQMAIFIIRARLGLAIAGSPPTFTYPTTPYFTDATAANEFAFPWIQRMKLENITSGCMTTTYCPTEPVTHG